MTISQIDSERAEKLPFQATNTAYRLDVNTVSASINLSKGIYNIHYATSPGVIVLCRIGAVPVIPTSGNATGVNGFFLASSNPYRMVLTEDTSLHGITLASNTYLWITKLE